MELWDLYNKYRQKIDRVHEKGTPMRDGEYRIVTRLWIINDKGEFLIQKRQPWKELFPDMWDASVAGSVIAGENSKEAVIRETKEELGIDINRDKLEFLFTIKFEYGFDDIWCFRGNFDINEINLQYEEVADIKWATKEEIFDLIENKTFIDLNYINNFFEAISLN